MLGALDSNHKIREESLQHLKALEKNPGYANNLIELYHQGNEYLQLICLLVLKASISRNWLVKNRFPDSEKENIKDFLLSNLQKSEKSNSITIEAISTINKYEYLDSWKTLFSHLIQFSEHKDYLKLLHSIVKIQLKKGSSRGKNSIKDLYTEIKQGLLSIWENNSEVLLDKIIIKFFSVVGTSNDIEILVFRSKKYMNSPNSQYLTKNIHKGIYSLLIKSHLLFSNFVPQLYEIYFFLIKFLNPRVIVEADTLGFVFLSMKELFQKFPEFNSLVESQAWGLFNKTLETELEECWEIWKEGDFFHFFDSIDDSDSDAIHKFLEALF